MAEIVSIYRYPVKGLSPEPLTGSTSTAGETLPFDRAWAIENGPSKFDPAAPKHLPKIAFLMLMRNERLAALQTTFDEAARTLTVRQDGEVVAEGRARNRGGARAALEAFFDTYEADELRGPARIVSAPGHAFTDTAAKCLSLINLETVRDIERTLGVAVHPLRFRGNLYVDGSARLGGIRLAGEDRRAPATWPSRPTPASTAVPPPTSIRRRRSAT